MSIDMQIELTMEKIVDKRCVDNVNVQYLVKWLNFEEKDNTWEPFESLDCQQLIDDYERIIRLKVALTDISAESGVDFVRLPVMIGDQNNAETVMVSVPPNESVYNIIRRATLKAKLHPIIQQCETIYRELSEDVGSMTCGFAVEDNRRVCIFTNDSDEKHTLRVKRGSDDTAPNK